MTRVLKGPTCILGNIQLNPVFSNLEVQEIGIPLYVQVA